MLVHGLGEEARNVALTNEPGKCSDVDKGKIVRARNSKHFNYRIMKKKNKKLRIFNKFLIDQFRFGVRRDSCGVF